MTPEPALFQTSGPVFLLYHICWGRGEERKTEGGEEERARSGSQRKGEEGEEKKIMRRRGRGGRKREETER